MDSLGMRGGIFHEQSWDGGGIFNGHSWDGEK